jgi:hypothetical protein
MYRMLYERAMEIDQGSALNPPTAPALP